MDLSEISPQILLLGASLAIGLLIGLERGWSTREVKEGERIAGIRTFGLIGLLGGCIGLMTAKFGAMVFALAWLGLCVVMIGAYAINLLRKPDISITTVIAAILTFTLGALATLDHVAVAGSSAVVAAILLSIKPVLHGWVKRIEQEELYAALKLLLISVVLLSILPNERMGPMQAFNPFEIWWMVVLVASISFLGYVSMKVAGPRKGTLLTAFFAGFASSTALTYEFSKLAKHSKDLVIFLSSGIFMACGIMFLRMLLFVAILKPEIIKFICLPALSMTFLLFIPVIIVSIRSKKKVQSEHPALTNPLDLKSALIFGLILVIIIFLSKILLIEFGYLGVYVLGLIAGLVDIDAFVLASIRISQNAISLEIVSTAILIAAFSNTCLKAFLAFAVGGKELFWKVSVPMLITVVLGGMLSAIGLNYL